MPHDVTCAVLAQAFYMRDNGEEPEQHDADHDGDGD